MLSVLKKYHSAAENLSDTVKKSGDFKIWITLDNNLSDSNGNQDEKKQVNMIVTPNKTAHEICKEMETQMGLCAHEMTLHEVILNGELTRPIHFSEKVLNIVLRWANWPEEDRKSNYLELRKNNKFHEQVERSMKNLTSFCPSMELKFADRKVKSLKSYTLELNDMSLNVLKAEKNNNIKVKEVDISNCVVYLGSEKKRDINSRWSLTFIELNFSKR
jgi:Arf-GAP with Rho-GAP domain, ANK repeat and PH domain-containing protein 1